MYQCLIDRTWRNISEDQARYMLADDLLGSTGYAIAAIRHMIDAILIYTRRNPDRIYVSPSGDNYGFWPRRAGGSTNGA